MTREEAISQLKLTSWAQRDQGNHYLADALDMAIEALQEPCNTDTCKIVKAYMNEWDKTNNADAISREAVKDILDYWYDEDSDDYKQACKSINALPSVEQEPKTGHWIVVHPLQADDEGYYMCSVCRCGRFTYKPTEFCPNCGAKMESEGRNDKKRTEVSKSHKDACR